MTFSADGSRGYISDLGPSSALLTTPIGEAVLFGDLITVGLLGPGRLIVFERPARIAYEAHSLAGLSDAERDAVRAGIRQVLAADVAA